MHRANPQTDSKTTMTLFSRTTLSHSLTLTLGLALPALAQTTPDAGQTLQQTKPPVLQAPRPTQGIDIQAPKPAVTVSGGMQVPLKSLRLSGNSAYSEAQLLAVLGNVTGKTYDLAGLKELANQITMHYRATGYPFARAFLPAQPMTDGKLTIEVVEGKYGQVKATGDASLTVRAQSFLNGLQTGTVIESSGLERASLILDDQPGIKTSPIIRPGQEMGTGDIDIKVERTRGYGGEVGLDNYGNRYTGSNRLRASMHVDSPFTLGDQITAITILTDESMWLGSVGYNLPIGSTGLRGNVGYSHTYYQIGKELADSNSKGTADVGTVGLSYPLIRSQKINLTASGSYQQKRLNDQKGSTIDDSKHSKSLPLALNFDVRDGLGGGGITYGALSWTSGSLSLGDTLLAGDANAQTNGSFDKINLDIARLQALPLGSNHFILFGRLSAQYANRNLDSSEDVGLGGANGVRAYPSGQGYGDAGWLTQLELRYSAGAYAPYAFYDAGRITTNAKPWAAGVNERKLAGAGVGLRYTRSSWNLDAALAWRIEGGLPQADTTDKSESGPQAWVNLSYKF